MNASPENILAIISLALAILSMVKPNWPLLSVSVVLLVVAFLITR